MLKKLVCGVVAVLFLMSVNAPAGAQGYSDSYKFLKAVKEGKGGEVETALSGATSTLINSKEPSTGDTAVHIVTRQRNQQWVRFFAAKGAKLDVQNREGFTPLGLAAQLGWLEGATALLDRRANVDLPNSRGETPLILAVQNRDLSMVRLLLSKGADPKRADRIAGYSALEYAKRDARSVAILKLLEGAAATPKKAQGPSL